MPVPKQPDIANRLLRVLSPEAYTSLQSKLELVELNKGDVLLEADTPYEWAYFPESGLASVIAVGNDNRALEVGLFGREGMGNVAVALNSGRSPHRTLIQVPGTGHRLPAQELLQLMDQLPELSALLLRYVQAFLVQVAQTALSNGSFSIENRLARWLLLARDRLDTDEIDLTHEFLSTMLGVGRTGVTLAMQTLEGNGLIRARRGLLTIVDRPGLEEKAAFAYGPAEREYKRLIGPLR